MLMGCWMCLQCMVCGCNVKGVEDLVFGYGYGIWSKRRRWWL